MKEFITTEYGSTLRERRKEVGKTQKQLAKKLGISQQSIQRIEKGDCFTSEIILKNLNKALFGNHGLHGKRCDLCVYSKKLPNNHECRYGPPYPSHRLSGRRSLFPVVNGDDWCFQFKNEN